MSDADAAPRDADALVPRRDGALAVLDELTLHPEEGIPKWFGRFLHGVLFRMVSMVEQPLRNMSGPLSPIDGYFRRDRHRHPTVDAATHTVQVTGVKNPRTFTMPELEDLPQEERVLVMECAGNGNHLMGSAGLIGQARWAGPSLATVLDACGGPGPATHFAFHGRDPIPLLRRGYHYGLSLDELAASRALLALTMNGEPLPRARGYPVRLVVPGIYSMSHVKWLGHIEGKTQPHMGVHNRLVFTNKELVDGRWVRVQARWIGLKSMITRCRRVADGWRLDGWAWGGDRPIERVEVSTDGGETWAPAQYSPPEVALGDTGLATSTMEHAWGTFTHRWTPPGPGTYRLASRAYDKDGRPQDLDQDPNVRGHFDQTRVKWRRVVIP